jgi:glyoxylate utilization-related uncharacterized protein
MTDSSRLLRATACFLAVAAAAAWPGSGAATAGSPYAAVDARNEGTRFDNLPGHTRSAYASDHALITPESRVYTGLFGWKDTLAAWFITHAMAGKPNFSMYQVRRGDGAIARDRRRPPTRRASSSSGSPLVAGSVSTRPAVPYTRLAHPTSSLSLPPDARAQALMKPGASAGVPAPGAWRFVFVMDGEVEAAGETADGALSLASTLRAGDFAYFPADSKQSLVSKPGASLLVYEKPYVEPTGAVLAALGENPPRPAFVFGSTDDLPNIETPGEVFGLKKLLPQTLEWDANFHVMDFNPGEYLYVKEIHYNQHGLMLLEGKGVYRLNDSWYSVQAGDVIWMSPFVTQWYAALGTQRSRYIILKDTNRDPIGPT